MQPIFIVIIAFGVILAACIILFAHKSVSNLSNSYMQTNHIKQTMDEIIDHIDALVYILEPKTLRVVYSNKRLESRIGKAPLGMKCHEIFYNKDIPCTLCPIEQLNREEGIVQAYSEQENAHLGCILSIDVSYVSWQGQDDHILCIARDVTVEKQEEELLRTQAKIDAMTGALHRRAGLDYLTDLLEGTEQTVCLVMLQLTHLQFVNLNYGHEIGDAALFCLVEHLRRDMKHEDVLCRLGGDAFLLVLHDGDQARANTLLESVQVQMAEDVEHITVCYTTYAINTAEPVSPHVVLTQLRNDLNAKKKQRSEDRT